MNETLNQVVNNEVKKLIGKYPNAQEFNSLVEYVTKWDDGDMDMEQLTKLIEEWKDEEMAECQNCGKWHLKEEMINTYGDSEYYCDEQCQELYQENFFDMRAEARAEYESQNR